MNTTTEKIAALRLWMQTHDYDYFVIPTSDPFDSEHLPDYYKVRQWLTGFTGSAGLAIIAAAEALLWTDSRYWLQAVGQLAETDIVLMREGEAGVPSPADWLKTHVKDGQRVVAVAETLTHSLCNELFAALPVDTDGGSRVQLLAADPFMQWWTDRPARPSNPIVVQPSQYVDGTAKERIGKVVQSFLQHADVECTDWALLLNDLSEVAWLTGLRGSDIEYNPVFMAYLLLTSSGEAQLFVNVSSLSAEACHHLQQNGIGVAGFEDIASAVAAQMRMERKMCLASSMNMGIIAATGASATDFQFVSSPVSELRMCKSAAEQNGFRKAMLADGVAMVRFLRWVDEHPHLEQETELTIDHRLTALRAENSEFQSLSFATIAAYGPHAAVVHYEAQPHTAVHLQRRGLLLLDSGAQYLCGTTDITRTIALGPVTPEERRAYTLVLKGHIGLSRFRFPEGTTGLQLDVAARTPIWQGGYDFGHGTGHGVGSHLCVHEGPSQIRKNVRQCTLIPFQVGQVVTNEPGIYVAGQFGVRIENMMLVAEAEANDFGRFLQFESLTLCPIDLRAADLSMLTPEEKSWLNDYHARVRQLLMPLLADEADRQWLEKATCPV